MIVSFCLRLKDYYRDREKKKNKIYQKINKLLGEITHILKGDNQGMFKHLIVCEFDYIMWLVKHIHVFQTVKNKNKNRAC